MPVLINIGVFKRSYPVCVWEQRNVGTIGFYFVFFVHVQAAFYLIQDGEGCFEKLNMPTFIFLMEHPV